MSGVQEITILTGQSIILPQECLEGNKEEGSNSNTRLLRVIKVLRMLKIVRLLRAVTAVE